ncbi:MAG: hypothetical protein IJ175_05810 [Clostridia bacterium]|nr:hypothetical protein [Clostridia bacterium]
MAKKGRKSAPEPHKTASDYYSLNTKAVEDLVSADVTNSPKVSEAELRRYRSGPKIRLADWMKAVLLKWWFAGAVCFFFLWGLGTVVPNRENQLIIVGLALGAVTDLFTNNIFRFYARTPGENDRWMMFPRNSFSTLPLNIVYGYVILFLVVLTYNAVNAFLIAATGVQDKIPLGVGPILFGLFCTGWDLLLLAAKRMLMRIVRDAKRRAAGP